MAVNLGISSKITIGLTTAGAIAAGGYITNEYLSGTKITELLLKNDLVLLSKGKDNEQWAKRWEEYVNKKENKWNISEYGVSSKNLKSAPENFKDACVYNSKRKSYDNESTIYNEVAEFCTKGFAISDLIANEKDVELINAQELTDPKWTTIWGRYFEEVKNTNPLELGDLKSSQKTVVPANYKTQCDKEKTKEVKNNKDPSYLKVKRWCTNPKTTRN